MSISTLRSRLVLGLGLATAFSAPAALPSVSLSFIQPTGTVGPSDVIEVWVKLTVNAGSSPLSFDASLGAPFGFNAADLPTQGTASFSGNPATFASYRTVWTGAWHDCSGNFTNGCNAGAYSFDFNVGHAPERPGFLFVENLDLQPDASVNYLIGNLTPTGGAAPAGSYSFQGIDAHLIFWGEDATGSPMYAIHHLGVTCPVGPEDCSFSRTVIAVPEPEHAWMLLGGLLAVGLAAQRRSRR